MKPSPPCSCKHIPRRKMSEISTTSHRNCRNKELKEINTNTWKYLKNTNKISYSPKMCEEIARCIKNKLNVKKFNEYNRLNKIILKSLKK